MVAEPALALERNDPAIEAAFEAARPELIAQIVGGVLHVSPRPARRHTSIASNLGILLGGPFRFGKGGPGGWVLLYEPELHLGVRPDKLVPDFAGWRRARMPDAAGGDHNAAYYDTAPDWICEVLSPSTEVIDRGAKMPVYAREGVGFAWLVDPVLRQLEVLRLEAGAWRPLATHVGDVRVRAEPFDAVELDLALVWSG